MQMAKPIPGKVQKRDVHVSTGSQRLRAVAGLWLLSRPVFHILTQRCVLWIGSNHGYRAHGYELALIFVCLKHVLTPGKMNVGVSATISCKARLLALNPWQRPFVLFLIFKIFFTLKRKSLLLPYEFLVSFHFPSLPLKIGQIFLQTEMHPFLWYCPRASSM